MLALDTQELSTLYELIVWKSCIFHVDRRYDLNLSRNDYIQLLKNEGVPERERISESQFREWEDKHKYNRRLRANQQELIRGRNYDGYWEDAYNDGNQQRSAPVKKPFKISEGEEVVARPAAAAAKLAADSGALAEPTVNFEEKYE